MQNLRKRNQNGFTCSEGGDGQLDIPTILWGVIQGGILGGTLGGYLGGIPLGETLGGMGGCPP